MRKRHDRESILAEVIKFAERTGRPPTANECKDGLDPETKAFTFGVRTLRRHFGTFNNMLETAGLPTRATPQPSQEVACDHCGEQFFKTQNQLRRTEHNFCSSSCAAKYFNPLRHKDKRAKACVFCGAAVKRSGTKFCSIKCFADFQTEEKRRRINESGIVDLGPRAVRRYLLKERGHVCEDCGLDTWKGVPIPLQVDHVDGNAENNEIINLRLLCHNCHALTPTFGAKNTGNGRAYRRQRYAEGKSY